MICDLSIEALVRFARLHRRVQIGYLNIPVLFRTAKTVLNMHSKFQDKLLCDGPTFSMGDACAYSCSFCYVPDMMRKAAYVTKDTRPWWQTQVSAGAILL